MLLPDTTVQDASGYPQVLERTTRETVMDENTYGLGLTPEGNIRRPSTYKKRYPKLKRGRRPNATKHEVVWWMVEGADKNLEPVEYRQYGVVLKYRVLPSGDRSYRVVRLMNPHNGRLFGPAVWISNHRIKRREADTPGRRHLRGARVVAANDRIGTGDVRGCHCQCCPHVAMNVSDVLDDGQFKWDKETEDE